eukprot:16327014-Heterocapsa_arctica.AAC.1
MTCIKATPQGGLKRKHYEAEAQDGPKKPAQGGQMQGTAPHAPPLMTDGMFCTRPAGQYSAGA